MGRITSGLHGVPETASNLLKANTSPLAHPHPPKYPAKAHLKQVVRYLKEPRKSNFILLAGAKQVPRGTSDQFIPFEQESFFYYCTGSVSPDWILLYDIQKENLTFYIPPLRTGRDIVYLGQLESVEQVKDRYVVDNVFYHDDLGGALILSMTGIFYSITDQALIDAMTIARSVKDDYEVDLCRRANEISCKAHLKVARKMGLYKSERQAEADFRKVCALHGASEQAYGPIFGSGTNASVLHYGANNAEFRSAELLLVDAACQSKHYAADVTRTYPISGKFSKKARILYETVLRMQREAIAMLKPGVEMIELQKHVHSILSSFLVQHGLVKCDLKVCEEKKLSAAFMMHGLGHHIGLDVHDVQPQTEMSTMRAAAVPSILAAAPLVAGNIVTVEPGIYFNAEFLSTFYENAEVGQYFDREECDRWIHLGGVRLEDCLLITPNGFENLTSMAKEITQIERICSEMQNKQV